jgi:hypothetical protein
MKRVIDLGRREIVSVGGSHPRRLAFTARSPQTPDLTAQYC